MKEKLKITKENIKALKSCEYLGIRYNSDSTGDIRTQFECGTHNHGTDKPWGCEVFEVNHSLHCNKQEAPEQIFCSADNYQFGSNPVALLANILKPGFEIVVEWRINNSSDWSERKGLVRDECQVIVYKPAPNKNNSHNMKWIGGFTFDFQVTDKYDNILRTQKRISF